MREGVAERGREVEGRRKSGSLRNKVRELGLFVACPFFRYFLYCLPCLSLYRFPLRYLYEIGSDI